MTMQGHKEIRQTGAVGKVFRFLFFGFNILMVLWLVSYWSHISDMPTANSGAEKAGHEIGTVIGTFVLVIMWAAGAAILGGLMLATRGPRIFVPLDAPESPAQTGGSIRWKRVAIFAGCLLVAFYLLGQLGTMKPASPPAEQQSKGNKPAIITGPATSSSPSKSGCKVTLDQYNQLRTDMSYAQVASTLGCQGTELSRSDLAGYQTVMYSWDGAALLSNMNVMLQNNRLVSKSQFGLR